MAFLSAAASPPLFNSIARASSSSSSDDLCRLPSPSRPCSDLFRKKSCTRFLSFHQPRSLSRDASVSASSSGREVYQPYRPPPTVVPSLENLSIDEQLEILRERRGLWFEYAAYIPSLIRAGFVPSVIDESTGMTGVEQNKILVASQVRSSLQSSGMDEASLAYFDLGGADLLYELRILSTQQRKSAAEFVIERRMDPKDSRELARAMKDYERRKREEGWDAFSVRPGDCLAFACYRQSKECKSDHERENALNKALTFAVTEKARAKIMQFLEKGEEAEDVQKIARLQVVRLSPNEAGEAAMPYVLPVIDPIVQELEAAPPATTRDGPFSIHRSEIGWKSWVALPGWEPLISSAAPVAICYPNASLLPWKPKSRRELEEPILLVVDKHFTDLQEDTYFLVAAEGNRLGLQLGTVVSETGSKALGRVVLALRPPLPQTNLLEIEDWE